MRNLFSVKEMIKFSMPILLAMVVAILAGCGAGGASTASTSGGTTTVTNDAISLATSVTSIKTDNSTSATLTATVTKFNAVVQGIIVTFSTSSGNLSALTATSDSAGKATVILSSGASDFSNRTATVTATAGGFSANIPVLINGSTLALAASATSMQVGAGTITLAATASDAGANGKNGQTIRFSVDATSTGTGTLSAASVTTGVTGTTPNITFTPTAAGTVVIDADWLDSTGAVSVRASKNITVTAAAGIAFAITTPATDPLSLATSATQALAVTVPTTIGGTTVASVRTTATGGTWTGTAPVTATAASITQVPVANAVASTYTAPGYSGVMTVQVDALDASSVVLSTLTHTFVVSAPAASSHTLNINTSAATVAPSSGNNSSTAKLTATVRDIHGNSVGNDAVMFVLLNTTGTGESISPVVAYTNGSGIATATFTAGSTPTAGPIYARALEVGQTCTGVPQNTPPVAETNLLCDSTPLAVSSTAVSVSIGFGTTISDTANATQYLLPGSVLVVNGSGGAVANATVSLTVFPYQYRNGSITDAGPGCVAPATSFTASEDVNRNGFLDPGEDTPLLGSQSASQIAAGAIALNNILSPPQASGGSDPATVTTDINGAATFNLQYLKSSALFIRDEVTATVTVTGTQGSATTTFTLPMSATDATAVPCSLARTATY